MNKLAVTAGDFAALLFTWMIPHADDDGAVTADTEELLFTIFPGRRDKSADDISAAIDAICEAGLMRRDGDNLRFKDSFFKYQSYITATRRKSAQATAKPSETPQETNAQRKSAQNAASLELKSSSSSRSSFTKREARKRATPLSDDFMLTEELTAYALQHGISGGIEVQFEKFREHHKAKGSKFTDWVSAWRTWVLRDADYQSRNGTGNGSTDRAVEKAYEHED